jgi:uncharacterized membrane protein
MSAALSFFNQIAGYFFVIFLPIIVLYLVYLIITKSFRDMGFSTLEAIIIVFVSFILGAGIIDEYTGISFSNLPLFTYHDSWIVGINAGGAIIPILLSIYLFFKNRLQPFRIFLGVMVISIVTYFVTYADPERGIVSSFPLWLLPVIFTSLVSIFLYWTEKSKAAPFAYIIGTLGVLIGADVFHLFGLLETRVPTLRTAVIGGASVFDMVFITGILAVFLDGVFIIQKKRKKE